jgi:maltooligosyltrehalose trehalohydrolase
VRAGRRAEFASFGAETGWGGEVPDPAAEDTFRRSVLDRDARTRPPHSAIYALYRDLLALRRAEPALRPGATTPAVESGPAAGWVTATFTLAGRAVCVAVNLSEQTLHVPLPRGAASWRRTLSTDAARYGGGDRGEVTAGGDGPHARVAPLTAEVLVADGA